jgi:hypothetical protein
LDPQMALEALVTLERDIKRAGEHDEDLRRMKSRHELVSKYAYASAQGSNHRKSRRDRGDVVRDLLGACLQKS